MVRVAVAAVNRGNDRARKTNTRTNSRDRDAINKALFEDGGGRGNLNAFPSISDYFGVYDKSLDDDDDRQHGFWECWFMCKYQRGVRKWYRSTPIQVAVALLIFLNFLISAAGAQAHDQNGTPDWDLHGKDGIKLFFMCELFFNIVFTIELAINMFAHWWSLFWSDGWNWFDFIVVFVSLLSMLLPDLPGVAVLRLLRAFRVFRLFKRMESLRKIIKSLEESIPGVANAFMILMLVMSIYAILGVEFFRHTYVHPWNGIIQPNYFGTFGESLFTLFQTMTGESWSEAIARPCIRKHPTVGSIFFVSFVLINGFVLVNVAIAVLLEKMMGDDGPEEPETVWLIVKTGKDVMREKFDERRKSQADLTSPRQMFTDQEQNVGDRTVYVFCPAPQLDGALQELQGQRFLCGPPPPEEGEEEAQVLADDGTPIEPEIDEDDQTRRSVVVESTEAQDDPINPNNKLIKVVFHQTPYVERVDKERPEGVSQRKALARDGFVRYTPPPEKLQDQMRRIEHSLIGYIALLNDSLNSLNGRIDRLGMGNKAGGLPPPPLSGSPEAEKDDGVDLSKLNITGTA